jgi:thiol-disulfide isomerase/thioredoxin
MSHEDNDAPPASAAEPYAARPTYASPRTASSTKAMIGILLAGIAGMVILLFVHLSHDGRIRPGAAVAQAECNKGTPDCLPSLGYTDTTGAAYTHESLAGKVVLVNFWATWCPPCKKEIPDLSKAYDKYKAKGVEFLGMMIDSPSSQELLNFASDFDMTYPIVRATPQIMASYNEPGNLPTTFIYDRHGKQVFSHVGPLSVNDLDLVLDGLIAQR